MKLSKALSLLISATFLVPISNANDFNSVVDEIVASNPELKVISAEANADYLSMLTENNLANPEISLESLFGVRGDNKYNVGLSQAFDWPGIYGARSRRNDVARLSALTVIDERRSEINEEASVLVASIITSRNKIRDFRSIYEGFKSLLSTYENEYQKGNVSILDVNKLRIEVADHKADLDEEEQNLQDLISKLEIMAGDGSFADKVMQIESLPLIPLKSLDEYVESTMTTSQTLATKKARAELARTDFDVVKKSMLPGFSLGYRFSHEDGQVFNGFTFSMTLPAWGNKGKKAAAKANIMSSEIAMDSAEKALLADIRNEYSKASNLRARIDSYGKAVIASDNLALLKEAFEAGQINLTSYIQDIHYFINARINLMDLQQRYAESIFRLGNL